MQSIKYLVICFIAILLFSKKGFFEITEARELSSGTEEVNGQSTKPGVIQKRTQVMGMTWGLDSKSPLGKTNVSCFGEPKIGLTSNGCNAYLGDTLCTESLPVLCIKKNKNNSDVSNSEIKITIPIKGSTLSSMEKGNEICSANIGPFWKMAEFNDGSGWTFTGVGEIKNSERFWVAIKDQPANCWNKLGAKHRNSVPGGGR